MDFKDHVNCYTELLNNFHIMNLFKRDVCCALCDKYHLVIVFQYFMRAEFRQEDYTPKNFFLALTLSHDLYEDTQHFKQIIVEYYFSRKMFGMNKSKGDFHRDKLNLFRKMQHRGLIQRNICSTLFELIPHKALTRNRKELHTGTINNQIICEKCKCPASMGFREKRENIQEK